MRVPAVCNNCGTMFPSDFEVSDSTNISFSDCGAGPCPSCGGMGHIPDGIYNFIGNTIELLSGPSRTVKELHKLSEILEFSRNNNYSHQEVTSAIDKQLPELASIKDILPKTRIELYAFVTLILSIILMIISQSSSGKPEKIEINNVINNIYHNSQTLSEPTNTITPKYKKKKTGRNDPCPCGSGIKYKKCCLLRA